MQDRTRCLRAWLHDNWKIRGILNGKGADPDPTIVFPETQAEFDRAVDGWTDFAADLETSRENKNFVHCLAVSNGTSAVVVDTLLGGLLSWVRELFHRPGVRVFQNGAFDMPILQNHGIDFDWSRTFDTMLAGYALHPDEPVGLSHLVAGNSDTYAWKHESGQNLAHYCGLDAAHTFRLYEAQVKEAREQGQYDYLMNHLMPLLWGLIIPLHETGIMVDEPTRQAMLQDLEEKITRWQEKLAGHFQDHALGAMPLGEKGGFSYTKMVKLLYTTLKLPKQFNEEQKLSTEKNALERLVKHDSTLTVPLLLERSVLGETLNHLRSTEPSKTTGRVYTRFVLGGDEKHDDMQGEYRDRGAPRSGRLSSRDPNLQNVKWSARRIFCAPPGWLLVERDYSQIELRLNGYFSKDPGLQAAVDSGDAHLYIAWLCDRVHGQHGIAHMNWPEVYGRFCDGDLLVKKARKAQKNPTYGWCYRMGATKMEHVYGVPYQTAKVALLGLNKTFLGMVQWWDDIVAEASRQRYLQNPFGRRRYFHDVKNEVPKICNFPAQSTTADILFQAMRAIVRELRTQRDAGVDLGRLVLTVHDQVLLEGPEPPEPAILNEIAHRCMSRPVPELGGMVVPSDGKWGRNWGPMENPDTGEIDNPHGLRAFKEAA